MDKFQVKGLIIHVVIIFCAEVFVTMAWGVFLEEASKVFQVFLLVSFEVAAHNNNAPVGDTADTTYIPRHGCINPFRLHGQKHKYRWRCA